MTAFLSVSEGSNAFASTPWSLSPSGRIASTVALATSMRASALFSCSVAHAVAPSAETAMYSGSRSCAALAPGP